jgi:recombinational DNA repair ATPase RecF
MSNAKIEFGTFLRSLNDELGEREPDVLRLGNLILQHFDDIERTGTANSQRSVLLARLCRESLPDTPVQLPELPQNRQGDGTSWTQLKQITVGPFRGFRETETFNLQKQVLLIYGPNGSGKTSLCEAFELALLGNVQESEIRRIDADTYFKNIHAARYDQPILTAVTADGHEVPVVANEDINRFCFLEKNRIDSFSRLAARTPSQKTELISVLFGMETFNEFVRNFNESMDGQLKLESINQAQIDKKRQALAADIQLVSSEITAKENIVNEENAIATQFQEGFTYEHLKTYIGTTEAPGMLADLDAKLNQPARTLVGISVVDLTLLFSSIIKHDSKISELDGKLSARCKEVSFKQLYTAVLELQDVSPKTCPACDTPLVGNPQVITNPYIKAQSGLSTLSELAEIQALKQEEENALMKELDDFRTAGVTLIKNINSTQEVLSPKDQNISAIFQNRQDKWWQALQNIEEDDKDTAWDHLLAIAKRCEKEDAITREAQNERDKMIRERDRLREYQVKLAAQDAKRTQLDEKLVAARSSIEAFDQENASLIAAATADQQDILRDKRIKTAYESFLRRIREYRDALPRRLMAGLNDSAKNIYNSFNPTDHHDDLIADLRLPLDVNGRIEIAFTSSPTVYIDALQILSEGHIRCLGLAILLAKNIAMGSPLILFDDAINAIDHDHRQGIRETLFLWPIFAQKQLIVTCHSPEFIKDIQNTLPVPTTNHCISYVFRPHNGDHHPSILRNPPSVNYIEVARQRIAELNPRAALNASRQALESLTGKLWKWLNKYDMGELTLIIVGVGAEPQLRNLCEAILRKLSVQEFTPIEKPALVQGLRTLLGIPSESLIWRYLNKGTHEEEDRDDFDMAIVNQVVQILADLDAVQLRGPQR